MFCAWVCKIYSTGVVNCNVRSGMPTMLNYGDLDYMIGNVVVVVNEDKDSIKRIIFRCFLVRINIKI